LSETVPQSGQELRESDDFYSGVITRLFVLMAGLLAAGAPFIWIRFHRPSALSFIAGGVLAILNFYLLKKGLEAAVDAIQRTGKRPSSAGIAARFLLRYALIALFSYAIFNGSAETLYGLFAGLSLPVGAILIEAVYQTISMVRARV